MLARPAERRLRGVFPCQPLVFVESRHRREAMHRRRRRPRQLLARPGFDEGREPRRIIEHRRAQVDEPVHALGTREHPAHAMRAEKVAGRAVQPADDGLPLDDRKAFARNCRAQRERAAGHALTAGAVAGHGEKRRRADPEPHRPQRHPPSRTSSPSPMVRSSPALISISGAVRVSKRGSRPHKGEGPRCRSSSRRAPARRKRCGSTASPSTRVS
jgi:hypothetical protein